MTVPPSELQEMAERVMSWNLLPSEVTALSEAARRAIARDPVSRLVNEAQRLFLLGWAELGFGNRSAADRLFEESVEAAKASIAERETSEGYRALSDGYNQLLNIRGTAYKLFNHQAAKNSALKALVLSIWTSSMI